MANKTPKYDAKVKEILDALQPGERTCAATGEKWIMDEREIEVYKKFNVPPSKFSPMARMKLNMGYFVIFDVWYNKHAKTGEPLVTVVHPASGIKVVPDKEWFDMENTEYGRAPDFGRSFHEQMYELSRGVPLAAKYNHIPSENSIAFISLGDQDSHFVLACKSKKTINAMNAYDVEESAELVLAKKVRRSYNVVHSDRIYNCRFVRESFDCMESAFLFDCRNCEFCFGATNKRNKKYFWFNEQLTQEEWEKRRSEVDLSSYAVRKEYETKFQELMKKTIWPENFNVKSENVTGDYILSSTNIRDGYYVIEGCKDLDTVPFAYSAPSNDSAYCSALFGASDCYYCIGTGTSQNVLFGLSIVTDCINVEYCNSCYDCEYCFGCIGLRKKKYCIFNKQYTEEEYWETLDKIKCKMLEDGEYGDMPPLKFSTQHWAGSGAAFVLGMTEEEARQLGANMFNPTDKGAEGPEVDPDSIKSVDTIPDKADESMVGVPYLDQEFGRRFAYIAPEIKLLNDLGVAPSRRHPTARIHDLYNEMNYAVYEEATCKKCAKDIRVAKNRKYTDRIIYCRPCYLEYLEQYG